MRGDTRSLIHGIINLIVPFFIYDLASLLVGAITAANYNPWLAFWPMTILLWLPFVSDAVCVVVAAVRFQRRGRTRALLGLIFSVGAAALYYMLRFQLHFTLSQLKDMFCQGGGPPCVPISFPSALLSTPTVSAARSR